ncbi:MAG: hypothetical protein ACRYFZ_01750 [Janthinobacterium lividum]
MQPTTTPEAHATRPALPDEAERQALAAELEIHIDALNEYCDQDPQPERAQQINELIALFGQYDQATEQVLDNYRHALEHAQRPVVVPTLEQAILAKLSPADLLAHRQADPVYRLGWARSYRVAEQKYERLSSLYAQYAIIVPPAGYTPSPLVAQVQRFVATRLMVGPRFPLAVRKSLFFNTPVTPRHDA